jgi:hypothetical protein
MDIISTIQTPLFLTEQQVADRQGRSVRTLQAERLKGGGIPYIKFGRIVRYRLADIVAFEEAHLLRSTSDSRKGGTNV